MPGRALSSLLVLAAACGGRGPAPAAPVEVTPARPRPIALADDHALTRWLERELGPHVVSAAVALIGPGDQVRWRSLGAVDGRGGRAPDLHTRYRIGPLTKLVTATAVLQLHQRGVVDLDGPVDRWVPELRDRLAADPDRPVLVRHLLTHTAGVPSVGDGSAPYWTTTPPSEAALLRALDVELEAAPGERHAYSHAGMALAGLVVARASGQELRGYLAEHVLRPLGMQDAAWHRGDVPAGALAVGRDQALVLDAPHRALGAFDAAGGLYASLADLIAFAELPLGRAPAVLAPASLAIALADDPLPGPHGAAWSVAAAGEHVLLFHAGASSDYAATIAAVPPADRAVVVLIGGHAPDLADCVAAQLGRHLVAGDEPGSCIAVAPWPIADDVYVDAARGLRDLFAAPAEDAVRRVFAPDYVEGYGAERLVRIAGAAGRDLGACGEPTLDGRDEGGAIVRLPCSRDQRFRVVVEPMPPHRVVELRPLP